MIPSGQPRLDHRGESLAEHDRRLGEFALGQRAQSIEQLVGEQLCDRGLDDLGAVLSLDAGLVAEDTAKRALWNPPGKWGAKAQCAKGEAEDFAGGG